MQPTHNDMPGVGRDTEKLPGHWVLAQLGKKVLRPGGRELTAVMLAGLRVGEKDRVVEFAPGMGHTARQCLQRRPASYTAIEQNEQAAAIVRGYLTEPSQQCRLGNAQATGLENAAASVVYGEAMLTMQGERGKTDIIAEAARVLEVGGRYGIHELCIVPDNIDEAKKRDIQKAIAEAIQSPAKPLTPSEWRQALTRAGLSVTTEQVAPMHLLEPKRVLQDEGVFGVLTLVLNLLRRPAARARVLEMRRVFRRYRNNLAAITLVASKS